MKPLTMLNSFGCALVAIAIFDRRACDGEREETAEAQRGIHPRR